MRVPGDKILHPLVLTSIFALAINDHILKRSFENWWTGKLSDVAGMVFFPIFLVSCCEFLLWALRRPWESSRKTMLLALLTTAIIFTAINLSSGWGDFYQRGLVAFWSSLGAESHKRAVFHVVDPSDLLALPFLGVAYWIGEPKREGRPLANRSRASDQGKFAK